VKTKKSAFQVFKSLNPNGVKKSDPAGLKGLGQFMRREDRVHRRTAGSKLLFKKGLTAEQAYIDLQMNFSQFKAFCR